MSDKPGIFQDLKNAWRAPNPPCQMDLQLKQQGNLQIHIIFPQAKQAKLEYLSKVTKTLPALTGRKHQETTINQIRKEYIIDIPAQRSLYILIISSPDLKF